tara:strand:- start:2108 stop:5344 length:3237 start_codon:yes stop_codon:yes gene_type:complete
MPGAVSAVKAVIDFFYVVFWAAGVGNTAATVLSYIAAGATFNAIGGALNSLYKVPQIGLAQQGATVLSNSRSSSAPLPVIYGVRRVGGVQVFIGTSDGYTMDGAVTDEFPNEYLNMVIALCEGPIGAVEKVYANNVEIWPVQDERFQGKVFCNVHLGETGQTVDKDLKAISDSKTKPFEWGDEHRLRGIAYLYIRLEANEDVWKSGLPTINADVKGRMVEDTRNQYAGTAYSIDRYSNNPALCIRDYLMNSTYGRGIPGSQISDSAFEAAANYCDEEIDFVLDDGNTVRQKRFTLNGVVTVGESSLDILNKLLSSCRGMLVYTGGFYKLIIDKAESASLTFDESNILPNFNITLPGKNSLANRVSANYFNPDREWQADFEYVESAAYKTADNEMLLERKIELPFTADRLMAFYIAEQTMKQSRQGLLIEFNTTQEGLLAEVGDVIYIKLDAPGWTSLNSGSGKLFRVIQVTLEANDEVAIVAMEYDANVYVHGTASAIDTAPNTNLPSLSTVNAPTSITATETLLFNDPKITNRITLAWASSPSSYLEKYEVAYIAGTSGKTYTQAGTVTGKQFTIDNLDPGVYQFAVRSVNTANFKSDYVSVLLKVNGTNTLPAVNPPGITGVTESLVSTTLGSGIKAKAVLSWTAIANSDWEALGINIESYEVEYKLTSESTNFERLGSATGTFFEFFDIAPGNYDFRVRAVNDAGIKSAYSAIAAEITGLSAAPANVASFYLRVESTQANLSWTPSPDIDVKVGGTFEIRHSVATSGATWGTAIKIGSDVAGSSNSTSMPLLVGTYLIKAVDSTGNKSAAAKSIVNTVSPSLFDKRTAATVTDTSFAGTKTNMVIDSDTGYLKFEADTPWDSVAGDIDTWGLIDSVGGADLSGSYEFTNKIDLGAVANATLSSSISFNAVSTSDIWDNYLQNIDSWEAVDANTFDDLNATMFISSTNDDPASGGATWSDYQEFTIGNYYGRGFKFKVECTSGDATHQINITQLVAKAEVYYRFESETGTTNAGGTAFTYGTAFLSTPQIAITANDMATGDYYAITSSSATGFTLRFYNSSGTGISRTAYYLARGY